MGLSYEWTHFLVHTRYEPKSRLARTIRRNHRLHHCRNEDYWLAFCLPTVDNLFGTSPQPSTVPFTLLARGDFPVEGAKKSQGPLS